LPYLRTNLLRRSEASASDPAELIALQKGTNDVHCVATRARGLCRRASTRRSTPCWALRIASADAFTGRPDLDPDRASFTIALNTARAQLTAAAGVLGSTIDLRE
jgi:hypothetical protein